MRITKATDSMTLVSDSLTIVTTMSLLPKSVDVTFDVRLDSNGKDPDFASPTLRRFHKILWHKNLPNGQLLELHDDVPGHYLLGRTRQIEVSLSSDTMCNSYVKRKRMRQIVEPHVEEIEFFRKQLYSIGGFILFPARKVGGLNTINQERGWIKAIDDRFDLTLECIRLYYLGNESPLFPVLTRYTDFFNLFVDFEGYVSFFFLNDLVSSDFSSVNFFLPGGLRQNTKALPSTSEEYLIFMNNAQNFLQSRNNRIAEWMSSNIKDA